MRKLHASQSTMAFLRDMDRFLLSNSDFSNRTLCDVAIASPSNYLLILSRLFKKVWLIDCFDGSRTVSTPASNDS